MSAGAFLRGSYLSAQAVPNVRRLDIHHHFATPAWIQMVNTKKAAGYQTWQPYTPATAVEDMDRGGVACFNDLDHHARNLVWRQRRDAPHAT